ncbi:MAG TPA: YbaN family protein [Tenuifilaceae bacterium]|nr:YbaN family protein [Tenuifilaceae bacterium]
MKKSSKPKSQYVKALLAIAGIISMGLGILGIILPVLPTTPFFLLSAYLFLKSSQRLYRWLLTHRIFGRYIKNYIQNKSIGKEVKVFTLILLWATILFSVYCLMGIIWLQILLVTIAIAVTIHILRLKTTPKQS